MAADTSPIEALIEAFDEPVLIVTGARVVAANAAAATAEQKPRREGRSGSAAEERPAKKMPVFFLDEAHKLYVVSARADVCVVDGGLWDV